MNVQVRVRRGFKPNDGAGIYLGPDNTTDDRTMVVIAGDSKRGSLTHLFDEWPEKAWGKLHTEIIEIEVVIT